MAYKIDKIEANSDKKGVEQWANRTTEQLTFALNDIDKRIRTVEDSLAKYEKVFEKADTVERSQELRHALKETAEILAGSINELELRVEALEEGE